MQRGEGRRTAPVHLPAAKDAQALLELAEHEEAVVVALDDKLGLLLAGLARGAAGGDHRVVGRPRKVVVRLARVHVLVDLEDDDVAVGWGEAERGTREARSAGVNMLAVGPGSLDGRASEHSLSISVRTSSFHLPRGMPRMKRTRVLARPSPCLPRQTSPLAHVLRISMRRSNAWSVLKTPTKTPAGASASDSTDDGASSGSGSSGCSGEPTDGSGIRCSVSGESVDRAW